MSVRVCLVCVACLTIGLAPSPGTPTTPAELQQEIEKVLKETRTPGAAVAIVTREGPEWVAGIGLADVATKRPVTADTLFRIGSVSKGFVALAVLKLQQEGRLDLQDTLRSRAPHLEFHNPWEATEPVRMVHLLEHTSGWDDMALCEYAYSARDEMTLREGLAFHPASRVSRWRPGTRFSYSNVGPAAAAHVIEQVTGQRFEEYVEQIWFKPLGMQASYFHGPDVQRRLTTLYRTDGKTPIPYWHILLRPAGSINASAQDMANYVEMLVNRGSFRGVELLPPEAIERAERPVSNYAAREGLTTGYGLGNYTTVRARVFHGHNGGMPGALAEMAYVPEAGFGFVCMINSANGSALHRISQLVRSYVNQTRAVPPLPAVGPIARELIASYAGWYEPISPRPEIARAFVRILGLSKLSPTDQGLTLSGVINPSVSRFVPQTERIFRRQSDGAATLALIADRSEGQLLVGNGQTYRRISAWLVWTELIGVILGVVFVLSSIGFAMVWLPRKLLGHLRGVEALWVRALPAGAALLLVGAGLVLAVSAEDAIARFGQMTPWSIALFGSLLAFAGCAPLGVIAAVQWRGKVRRLVWWHAFAASLVFSVWAGYLAYWGVVGWRPWA